MLGRENAELNFILETANGVVLILSFPLLMVLTIYLKRRFSHAPDHPVYQFKLAVPSAVSLAVALYVDKLGMLLTRLSVWTWRQFGAGVSGGPMNEAQHHLLLVGTLLSAVGALWLIRVISRPMFGNWPWIASAVASIIYLIVALGNYYFLSG